MKYRIAYLFFEVLWPDLFSSLREGMILPSREYGRPITIVQSYAHERNLAKCDGWMLSWGLISIMSLHQKFKIY